MADDRQDPIEAAAPDRDLYDVATWEVRSRLDAMAVSVYEGVVTGVRRSVVVMAALIVLAQVGLTATVITDQPAVGAYILLSLAPALGLAVYVRHLDIGAEEPLGLLVGTFFLGFLFAGFASILNSALIDVFFQFGAVGTILFFYLVVGPVEETVKLLAVRLYAYPRPEFTTVVDGAIYGAMAGLGFATIENSLYITQQVLTTAGATASLSAAVAATPETLQVTAIRSFAGPGHVIYSAFAGYYLGLARFNADNAGPIAAKGLLIAAAIHGTYNVLVSALPGLVDTVPLFADMGEGVVFVLFVVVYDGVFGLLLYQKLARYRRTYIETGATDPALETDEEPA
ncbi:MAG: PrsW family intramembrane metalloprotease [Halobacteriaceae archaeon]